MSILLCIFLIIFIYLAYLDYEKHIIPNELIGILLAVGIVYNLLNKNITMKDILISILIIIIPLFLFSVFFRNRCFHGGDIKLFLIISFFFTWKQTLFIFFVTCILISLTPIILLFKNITIKESLKKNVPIAPYALAATFIQILKTI